MKEVYGDNYAVRVLSAGRAHFDVAVKLAFNGSKASHYAISTRFGMIFLEWVSADERKASEHSDYVVEPGPAVQMEDGRTMYEQRHVAKTESYRIESLPYPMDWTRAAEFSWGWLEQVERPAEPGHDGSNTPGFEVSTGDVWGHVGPHRGAICHIRPEWLMLDK